MKLINPLNRRLYRRKLFCRVGLLILFVPLSTITFYFYRLLIFPSELNFELYNYNEIDRNIIKNCIKENKTCNLKAFIRWDQSLCSYKSHQRGRNQKVIAISMYGESSKYTENSMFSWNTTILPFITSLSKDVELLLPTWVIRVYIDYTGSSSLQRRILQEFSNIDVCDINELPFFNSSLFTYLSGKMWRFIPIFDPLVDFMLSRDLDSPIVRRETETIDMWLSDKHKEAIFYIARDHQEHGAMILGGLWGAAPSRARSELFHIFETIFVPSIASRYNGTGDQQFLSDFVWDRVRSRSLIFDSYFCEKFDGQPFLSQRPTGVCFLGCIRPCCTNITHDPTRIYTKSCPIACRPKDHQDWEYC